MISSAAEFKRLRISKKPEEYQRAHLEEGAHEVWLEVIRDFPDMREWVARNRTVSVEILRVLAVDEDPRVRFRVSTKGNAHKTPDILEIFSRDAVAGIRLNVAKSPNASSNILERLSQDTDEWVRIVATARFNGLPVPELPRL